MTISYSTKITSSSPPYSFTGLYTAISNAYNQHDVVFTASTGNQGNSNYYAFPANFDEVIGVGGSDKNDNYIYNNYAPGNVEIAAPAVDISTVCKGGDIGALDGTSFGTPMVAGAVMLLRDQNPTWSNDQIRQRLQNTAVPMADQTKSGAGRMDVAEALGVQEPLTVMITGPSYLDSGESGTWYANPQNGSGGYSYQWYYQNVGSSMWNSGGTSSSYNRYFNNSNSTSDNAAVKVVVTSGGEQSQVSKFILIYGEDCPDFQICT